jgi:hypothetical protein
MAELVRTPGFAKLTPPLTPLNRGEVFVPADEPSPGARRLLMALAEAEPGFQVTIARDLDDPLLSGLCVGCCPLSVFGGLLLLVAADLGRILLLLVALLRLGGFVAHGDLL